MNEKTTLRIVSMVVTILSISATVVSGLVNRQLTDLKIHEEVAEVVNQIK